MAAYELRVGTVLHDKWRLERLIGIGGMAAVYAARHRVGTQAAIKILHPEIARSADARLRFEQEAMVMGKLEHPGTVAVRDIDVCEDGCPFMVMELLDGETLKQRLERNAGVSIEDLLRWSDELCDVLAAAHAAGIIHRHVKLDHRFVMTGGGI